MRNRRGITLKTTCMSLGKLVAEGERFDRLPRLTLRTNVLLR